MHTLISKLPCAGLFANFFLALLLCTDAIPGAAQTLSVLRHIELPDASGATTLGEYAFACNPALCADIDSTALIAVVTPSRFGMSELARGELGVAVRSTALTWAAGISGTGTSLYNELSATGFFSWALSPEFCAGAAVGLLRLGIRDALPQTALYAHLGGRLRLTPSLSAGAALYNITRTALGDDRATDQSALLSLGVDVTPDLAASAGALVHIGRASALLLTGAYRAVEPVTLRFGIRTFPRSAEAGVACRFETFTVIGTLHYHDRLGFSQSLGCVYRW